MAKFSRPHYQLIASILRRGFEEAGECNGHIYDTAEYMADALKADNPAFNWDHFMAVVRGEAGVDSKPPRSSSNQGRRDPCRVSNCEDRVYAEGYCEAHWNAKHRT